MIPKLRNWIDPAPAPSGKGSERCAVDGEDLLRVQDHPRVVDDRPVGEAHLRRLPEILLRHTYFASIQMRYEQYRLKGYTSR